MTGLQRKPAGGNAPAIVWFRFDLRVTDNPALDAAIAHGGPVVPVFVWAPEEEAPWAPGAASRWWLHHSLNSLAGSLGELGSGLIIRKGSSLEELRALLAATGAETVFWNRTYEPALIARDTEIKQALRNEGYTVESFKGSVLNEPWTIQNKAGKPFQVFSAYWRRCLEKCEFGEPAKRPSKLSPPHRPVQSLQVDDLELLPKVDWAEGLRNTWRPGEAGAQAELGRFLTEGFDAYGHGRDLPATHGTSRLSPHLHFGEVSPRQIWHAIATRQSRENDAWRKHPFITELGWREFGRHLLFHFPTMTERPLREAFERFPWRQSEALLEAWRRGRTGVPFVDAGMRQLWRTGWMHNRVRMVAASFLVKNLLIHWQDGARWFWDTLVDADLANNTLGWQWVTGCGADAAPYFRIFNPVAQGQKFDPDGSYVREWVPELSELPGRWVHEPHRAPQEVLRKAGIELGKDYPEPLVSLFSSRNAALAAYQSLQRASAAR